MTSQRPAKDEADDGMDWQLDPEESQSDYTITVTWKDDDASSSLASRSFHVHKGLLNAGARKCQYFRSALKHNDSGYREAKTNASRIELPKLSAMAMPQMLNYIYGASLQITTETAVPLYHHEELLN